MKKKIQLDAWQVALIEFALIDWAKNPERSGEEGSKQCVKLSEMFRESVEVVVTVGE